MNTYTERSGATHVCSGQLLSGFRERGTPEGLHRSINVYLIYQLNVIIPVVLWQLFYINMWLFNPVNHTCPLAGSSLCAHVVQTTTA